MLDREDNPQNSNSYFQSRPSLHQLNVVCLPQAGGDTSVYNRWKRRVASSVAIFPACLPGRGMRFQEPALNSMDQLTALILEAMSPFFATPYAILGSSMGSWIGYNLCLEIAKAGFPAPTALIACAATTPFNRRPLPFVDTDDRAVLLREIVTFNPDFEKFLKHDELIDLLLPAIKADFQLCNRWLPARKETISAPIFAFAGDQDRLVDPAEMKVWEQLTASDFHLEVIHGDHFFIEEPPDELASLLSEQAHSATSRSGSTTKSL